MLRVLTNIRTQSHENLRVVPWVLTFVRMTDRLFGRPKDLERAWLLTSQM